MRSFVRHCRIQGIGLCALLLAPDSMAFFQRSYDAGICWVYVLDRFSLQPILDLMDSSTLYDGRHAVDHAFAPSGLSFFDI